METLHCPAVVVTGLYCNALGVKCLKFMVLKHDEVIMLLMLSRPEVTDLILQISCTLVMPYVRHKVGPNLITVTRFRGTNG